MRPLRNEALLEAMRAEAAADEDRMVGCGRFAIVGREMELPEDVIGVTLTTCFDVFSLVFFGGDGKRVPDREGIARMRELSAGADPNDGLTLYVCYQLRDGEVSA